MNGLNASARKTTDKTVEEFYELTRRATKELKETAKYIADTRSFTKSNTLKTIRKRAEAQANAFEYEASVIYCGEYAYMD
jgi:uncharacterized protein (DUF885 family)